MSTTLLVILIGLVVIAAIAAWAVLRKRRTTSLRSRFGPEYEHAVHEYGDRSRAERALEHRAERAELYNIRSLDEEEQLRFSEEWRLTQARFVDDPPLAIREADQLVCEVMRTRGYPMADFGRRAEDLSVGHPHVVRNYRAAHAIAITEPEGRATTEDLRRAMVHYRELFDELLAPQPIWPTWPTAGIDGNPANRNIEYRSRARPKTSSAGRRTGRLGREKAGRVVRSGAGQTRAGTVQGQ